MLQGMKLSLYSTKYLIPRPEDYVGLANYNRLISDPAVWNSLKLTLIYAVSTVVGAIALGLICALLLNANLKGRAIARTLITVPWAVPVVASALIWVWIFNPQQGVLNYFLSLLGLIKEPQLWLISPKWALFSVITVDTWAKFPVAAVVLLTALQAVDPNLYEAARIDGAGNLAVFRYVLIPSIRSSLNVITVLFSIWALRRFTTVWILTQGGPTGSSEVLVVKVYREIFAFFNAGYASTIAVLGLVLAALVTLIYFRMEVKNELN